MKKFILSLLAVLLASGLWAQHSSLRGRVLAEGNGASIAGATVTLGNQNVSTITNAQGEFSFVYLETGDEEVIVEAEGYTATVELIQINDGANQIDIIYLKSDLAKETQDEILLSLSDQDLNDDEGATQEQASTTSSSNDVFNSLTSWAWGTARYRNRGYAQTYETYYIEGLSFNSAERGQFNFSAMGGLNDASRYKETNQGIEATNFTFGGLGNATNYLMSATRYAQGWKVGLAGTNRNYKGAVRATYSSGLLDNGWAFTGQLAFRGSPYIDKKGIIGEGINYYSLGYFFSAEKQWGLNHKLNIITFGAPTLRGQSAAVTQEVYNLTNQYNSTQWGWNNYNPYWGYQNGQVRNSRIVHSYDPTLIIGYDFKIDTHQWLHVAIGGHYSFYSNSALNFYNAPDPRPDYYRNMPSSLWDGQLNANGNFLVTGPGNNNLGLGFEDPNGNLVGPSIDKNTYMSMYNDWTSRNSLVTQIDWDAIYATNYANNANNPTGSARYIQERRHNDIGEVMGTVNYKNTQFDHLKMTAGLELKESVGRHYKTLDDLLGGNQWIDIDPFSERDIAELAENIGMTQTQMAIVKQNDIRFNEDGTLASARRILQNDRFGYNYSINMMGMKAWYQNEWTWHGFELYYALQLTYSQMIRSTTMLNGRAVYLSLLQKGMQDYYIGQKGMDVIQNGTIVQTFDNYKGFRHHFVDPAFKAGFNYKINGRNSLKLNAMAMTQAPLARNAYLSPRVHDRALAAIYTHDRAKNMHEYFGASEKIVGADLSYEFNYPIVRGRLTAYYSRFWDGTELNGYYDDEARTFVNQAMTGLNRRHTGAEVALSVKLGTYFTLSGAAAVGDYRYTSNASVVTSAENGMALAETTINGKQSAVYEVRDSVMMKGVRVSNGPQVNASLKLSFFHPKMWFADVTVSYHDWNYMSVAPSRRLQSLYTDNLYDNNTGNPINVNGSYKDAGALQYTTDENGENVLLTDEYGKPELKYPYNGLDQQERLTSTNVWDRFLVDVSVGKLIYLPQRQSLSINLSCTNVANNVHFKTGGYQQARLPRANSQGDGNSNITTNAWKFPSKYYYAWGANFYLTITYKF
ncbi:MAG: carboxypeptidase regulatory-like domain-containing protein [Paludibacteraceae bacterium]|nr:carboxypeptidase regulatory-like domain-containing protein [Paludibacteraceae bacterium]